MRPSRSVKATDFTPIQEHNRSRTPPNGGGFRRMSQFASKWRLSALNEFGRGSDLRNVSEILQPAQRTPPTVES
jgi:hypothetical protein